MSDSLSQVASSLTGAGLRPFDSFLLIISIGALGLAIYQSWLTRQALRIADESLRLTRNSVHLEMLPRGHVLVHVKVKLEQWQRDITSQILRVEAARLGDLNALRDAASHAERGAKGLIIKPMYDSSPAWLQAIYEAGVQHYYLANGPFVHSLWEAESDRPKYGIGQNFETDTVLSNLREGDSELGKLLAILNDLLPDVWLNSPASLSDNDFFDH